MADNPLTIDLYRHQGTLQSVQIDVLRWTTEQAENEVNRFIPSPTIPSDVYQVRTLDGHTRLMRGNTLLCEYWFTIDYNDLTERLVVTMHRRTPSNAPMLGGQKSDLAGDEPMLGGKPE